MRQWLSSVCLVLLSGCSLFPDRSLDYLQANTIQPLTTDSQSRPIKPLYAIPVVSTPAEQVAQVVQSKGRKQEFVVPSPKPLVLSAAEQTTPKTEENVEQKPSLIFDGNQHPVLMVTGEQLKLWEQLGQAISAAKVKITDRNQSSGLYFIELSQTNNKKESYLLKLSSTTAKTVVSLQKDEDTLADSALSQQVLTELIKHWPS